MILGMSLAALLASHVILSLIAFLLSGSPVFAQASA